MGKIADQNQLTFDQKQKIWAAINALTTSDDRDPQEVIQKDYQGNEEKYLRDMARHLQIQV
jgi:hypothetical protein